MTWEGRDEKEDSGVRVEEGKLVETKEGEESAEGNGKTWLGKKSNGGVFGWVVKNGKMDSWNTTSQEMKTALVNKSSNL